MADTLPAVVAVVRDTLPNLLFFGDQEGDLRAQPLMRCLSCNVLIAVKLQSIFGFRIPDAEAVFWTSIDDVVATVDRLRSVNAELVGRRA